MKVNNIGKEITFNVKVTRKEYKIMKLFKTIDDKFAEIGFTKIKEDKYGVGYIRCDKKYKFTQCLDIMYKEHGPNIIQSYDLNLY